MKLGKVIGKVVSTIKDPGLDSLRLLIVQGLDDNLEPDGNPYVAADGIFTSGPGDIVYLVSKKEAAIVFSKELVPIDECIVGFVEEHFVAKHAKKKPRKRKLPPTISVEESQSEIQPKPPKKTISKAISSKQPQDTPPKTTIPRVVTDKQSRKKPARKKSRSQQTKIPSQRRQSQ